MFTDKLFFQNGSDLKEKRSRNCSSNVVFFYPEFISLLLPVRRTQQRYARADVVKSRSSFGFRAKTKAKTMISERQSLTSAEMVASIGEEMKWWLPINLRAQRTISH